jgi:predicted secreted protein
MKLTSAVAIYFVVWWTVLFAILPIGVRNAHEAGEEVPDGHEPGAPVNPQIARKALITTVVSAAVFGLIYLLVTQSWFTLADLPF